MATMSKFLVYLLLLNIFFIMSSDASKASGFSLKLIPRDAPESPLYSGNLTQLQIFQRMIKYSEGRAKYLNFMSEAKSTNATKTLQSDVVVDMTSQMLYYLGDFGIGTPAKPLWLMIDSGSGLTWTQCEPCIKCYPQKNPKYDSRASSTYKKISCANPLCRSAPKSRCVNSECLFEASYGTEGMHEGPAKGVLSMETFSFKQRDSGRTFPVKDVIFGCANDNTFSALTPAISGIAGFSLSPISFFMQHPDVTDMRFSYCIVPHDDSSQAHSWLRFGNDIPKLTKDVQATKMFEVPLLEHIFLALQDISVASGRLKFPPGTFINTPGGTTTGFIIDSGAPLTMLDTNSNNKVNAFQAVMNAFQRYYDTLQFRRIPDSQHKPLGLSLCYKSRTGFEQQLASMTYHFPDANYHVERKHVHIIDNGMFCVAVLPTRGISILGIVHQQDMRIVYDGKLKAVQFQPEKCASRN